MPDDSLPEMPEFDKPENIPVVIIPPKNPKCKATAKSGKPCTVPAHGDTEYCIGHDPGISREQRVAWSSQSRNPIKDNVRIMRSSVRYATKFRTPAEVVRYAEGCINELDAQYGVTNLATLEFRIFLLRVILIGHREGREQALIALPEKQDRSIEIIERDAEKA